MNTLFVRLLEAEDKGAELEKTLAAWRAGSEDGRTFEPDPSTFSQVPGSPFAYWVSNRIRALFQELPPFESGGRVARQGLATADDFRFARAWWEVDAHTLGKKWFPFAKGGKYSPFYADVHLVVNWGDAGREMKAWAGSLYNNSHWSRILKNVDFYFRPGLTWPLRSAEFAPQVLPSGCVFSVRGYAVFSENDDLLEMLAVLRSTSFDYLFKVLLGRFGFPEFVVGQLQRMPWVDLGREEASLLKSLCLGAWAARRAPDTASVISHTFLVPGLLRASCETLRGRALTWTEWLGQESLRLEQTQSEINNLGFRLYGLDPADRELVERSIASRSADEDEAKNEDDEVHDMGNGEGADLPALCSSLLEWCVGVAFGRFDISLATGERQPPPDPDPFHPLPACSPGMLKGDDGLPAREPPPGYPIAIPKDGILVDDPGHPDDLARRIQQVFDLLDGDRGHSWLEEACEALGSDLRTWLARACFDGHLRRYSKSRRKAPIFWQLGTTSRSYSVWLYYPRLTKDTLYRVLNDYVTPKLRHEEQRLLTMTQEAGRDPTARQRGELAAQESFVEDLRAFRQEVERVAPLWRPAMDDGVILNFAPLWRLAAASRSWQRELKGKWKELQEGKYDWAQWAMHLWPERVVPKCVKARSLAIAHGLEEVFWEETADGKWQSRTVLPDDLSRFIAQRSSPAVKAALESLAQR